MGMLMWRPFEAEDVDALVALVASGAARPVIHGTYPLDDVPDALRLLESGRARGKIVIAVGRERSDL